MDRESDNLEPRRIGSFGHSSRFEASLRRRTSGSQINDDLEDDSVSNAGDISDRALHINRHNTNSGRIQEDVVLQSYGFWSHDPILSNTVSPVSPLPMEIISPLSTDAIIHTEGKERENKTEVPWFLEYITCLIYLAVFGILGVLTRYLLQKLFGPGDIGATSDKSYMYLDLPSNMVGSFLMGWWGVVFKRDITKVSDHLAIGLTTGYLGSLTTFSGWNQKMLELSVEGKWVFAVLGIFIGLILAAYSIIFGVETAAGFKWILQRQGPNLDCTSTSNWKVANLRRHLAVIIVLLLMLGVLWGVSGALLKREFGDGGSEAQLWLACLVGPPGVWIRWFLARLNGRGLGKSGSLKWVPFGTLIANVSAACIMAALATVKKVVNTKDCETVANGIQFGLLGCLSTVSTFMAEFHAMRQSSQPWRAYAYAMITISISFALGTLIYSVPVWTKGYD
ncbi:hypothetical protein LguiA_004519 [Lonicera macranthoides]